MAEGAPSETIVGIVERVTFHNPENGFRVLRVKARGHRDLVTTVDRAALQDLWHRCRAGHKREQQHPYRAITISAKRPVPENP